MSENIPKESLANFDRIAKLLSAAIKNSELYTPHHPSFIASLEALLHALEAWFVDAATIVIGVTHDNLLLDGVPVKEGDGIYAETAKHLHGRRMAAVSFSRGITVDELAVLLRISKVGFSPEVVNALKECAHLSVKELDYSALLHSGESAEGGDEKEVWRSLTQIGAELRAGQLPESKSEFVTNFLHDTKRSASALNAIYKDALARLDADAAVKDMRTSLTDIARHFKDTSAGQGSNNVRKDIADILLGLDSNLVAKLFEGVQGGVDADNLVDDVLKGFSDEMVADFILGLVGEDGKINENLIKLFDKLVADPARTTDITALVMDKFSAKQMGSLQTLSMLHSSMKELLKDHGGSEFLSGMYKLTVDVFADKQMDVNIGEAHKLLGKECAEFMSEESLVREKSMLLANLIWLERDPAECGKLVSALESLIPILVDPKFIDTLADIYDLVFIKEPASSGVPDGVRTEVRRMEGVLSSDDAAKRLVSLVTHMPDDSDSSLAKILRAISSKTAPHLLSEYIEATHPETRNHYGRLLLTMGSPAATAIAGSLDQLISSDDVAVKDLFRMLERLDGKTAGEFAGRMIVVDDAELRLEAFGHFSPDTDSEMDAAIAIIMHETRTEIKQKILITILQKGDARFIGRLLSRRMIDVDPKTALHVIKLCGDLRVAAAFPYLAEILGRRHIFMSKRLDELRVAALVSVARFGTKDADAMVERALRDRSKSVRRMAGIIRQLGNDAVDTGRG